MVIQEVETLHFCGSAISEDYEILCFQLKVGERVGKHTHRGLKAFTSSTLLCWIELIDVPIWMQRRLGKAPSMVPAFQKQLLVKKYSVLYTPNVGGHLTIAVI